MLWLISGIILIGMIIHISSKDKEYMDKTEIQSMQELNQIPKDETIQKTIQTMNKLNQVAIQLDKDIPITIDGVSFNYKRLIRETKYNIIDKEIGEKVCRDLLERYEEEKELCLGKRAEEIEEVEEVEEISRRFVILTGRIKELKELL